VDIDFFVFVLYTIYKIMNIEWYIDPTKSDIVVKMTGHKVCDVYQQRTPNFVKWSGSLDNDDYFLVIFINMHVLASVSDREMKLPWSSSSVAKPMGLYKLLENSKDQINQELIDYCSKEFPKVMSNITFDNIMNLFLWEYDSPKVCIYEEIV
jgi:hypothetical protein